MTVFIVFGALAVVCIAVIFAVRSVVKTEAIFERNVIADNMRKEL
jgi:hypothetical protein